MNEKSVESLGAGTSPGERACAYRILRYAANLVRDEWVNIGVLVFDPKTGERRLRLIEEQDEYNRVRRLHPQADETLLRALRDDLEDRFQSQAANGSNGGSGNRQQLLGKWDDTLSRHCNWPRKKASLPRTSMANLSASTPTTSPCSAHRGDVVGVEALKIAIEVRGKDAFLRGQLQCLDRVSSHLPRSCCRLPLPPFEPLAAWD